jgi:hypothetical protein
MSFWHIRICQRDECFTGRNEDVLAGKKDREHGLQIVLGQRLAALAVLPRRRKTSAQTSVYFRTGHTQVSLFCIIPRNIPIS